MGDPSRPIAQRPIVIRGLGVWQLRSLLALAAALLLLLGWGLYALGRSGIGFGDRGPFSDPASLRLALAERDATIVELRRQVAELDTLKAAQEQERAEVSQTIGSLQAEVARQRQQLEFYKGVVATTEAPPEVAIRSLRVDRLEREAKPVLRLSLVQPGNPRNTVSGTVRLFLEGVRSGRPVRLQIAEIPFSFRYFENIERELSAPPGVIPERLTVELRSGGGRAEPVVQSVPWAQVTLR